MILIKSKLLLLVLIQLSLAVLITSCAILNKDECKTANWHSIGLEDGSEGYLTTKVNEYRAACAEYGITADITLYNEGREKGLYIYCEPMNAYDVGIRGSTYKGVCSAHHEKLFISAFKLGEEIYFRNIKLQEWINELNVKIKNKEGDKLLVTDIYKKSEKTYGSQDNKITLREVMAHEAKVRNIKNKIISLKDTRETYLSEINRSKSYRLGFIRQLQWQYKQMGN